MAPGYAIALGLEAAGSVGLVLALVALRVERRSRAATLAGALRSGAPPGRRRDVPLRFVDAPAASEAAAAFVDARSALHRAIPTARAA